MSRRRRASPALELGASQAWCRVGIVGAYGTYPSNAILPLLPNSKQMELHIHPVIESAGKTEQELEASLRSHSSACSRPLPRSRSHSLRLSPFVSVDTGPPFGEPCVGTVHAGADSRCDRVQAEARKLASLRHTMSMRLESTEAT